MEKKPRHEWLQELLPNDIAAKAVCNVVLDGNSELLKRDCAREYTLIDAFVFMDTEEGYDYWQDIHNRYIAYEDTKDNTSV